MAFLVRKVARAKWPEELCNTTDIPGDAIADLRTTNNTLSLWRIESEDELEKAALALSASSKTERIENVSLVWIPEKDFEEKGLVLDKSSAGDTVISDLVNTHCDLCDLSYGSLGTVASTIMKGILKEGHYKRYSKKEIKTFLVNAYLENKIEESKCKTSLIDEIKTIANSPK